MYIVIKTIKGRQYAYEQYSWREGKRVRTKSRYLGPIGGTKRFLKSVADFVRTQGPLYRSLPNEEEELLKDVKAKDEAYTRLLERVYKDVGFRFKISPNPVPIEKPTPALAAPALAVAPAPPGKDAAAAPGATAAGAPSPDPGEKDVPADEGETGPSPE
jgi:hypothetical protein